MKTLSASHMQDACVLRRWIAVCSLCAAIALAGCSHAKVAFKIVPRPNWQAVALAVPDELLRANLNLSLATGNLLRELTTLPAPRDILLSDLAAELKPLENDPDVDCLSNAKDDKGKPIEFRYARFDEPTYDAFLKEAALAKALTYQTLCTMQRILAATSVVLDHEVTLGPSLHRTLEQTLARPDLAAAQRAKLTKLQRLGRVLGALLPRWAKEASELGKRGRELALDSASVFASTKIVLHLPAVTTSLVSSAEAIEATGRWAVEAALLMRGFAHKSDKRAPYDIEEGRLDRAELEALLYTP